MKSKKTERAQAKAGVTYQEIAEAAGVSTYVVSKALNGQAGVAEETRERGKAEAARQLHARGVDAVLVEPVVSE